MEKTAEDQSPQGSQQSLQGSQEASPRGQTPGLPGGGGGVNVQIPMALYENLSHLVVSTRCANVAHYVVEILRDEVNRDEFDNGTTGYSKREIELIRKLLRDAECCD